MDCSFVSQYSPCGAVGPDSLLLPLEACKLDLTSHLAALGISSKRGWRTGSTVISEKDLILNRARHFCLPDESVAAMTICPKHRRELTVDWPGRKRQTCGYPTHKGKRKQIRNPRRVNFAMSHEIFNRHGAMVPAGTGKLSCIYMQQKYFVVLCHIKCPFCSFLFSFLVRISPHKRNLIATLLCIDQFQLGRDCPDRETQSTFPLHSDIR